MSDVLTVQEIEAPRGAKKQGYLVISEKPAGPHKIPITLINGSKEGPTLIINGGEHGSEYHGPAATLAVMKEL
ncbi:MAG: deacylase, partial [Candidatus Bathyarchaeota archaeon]